MTKEQERRNAAYKKTWDVVRKFEAEFKTSVNGEEAEFTDAVHPEGQREMAKKLLGLFEEEEVTRITMEYAFEGRETTTYTFERKKK